MPRPLTLDGRYLEGGGQLVRVALSLSALCGIPVRIHSIRGRRAPSSSSRKKPGGGGGGGGGGSGLKESHLAALLALQRWCDAEVEGASVGSTEIVFAPRTRRQREGDFMKSGSWEQGFEGAAGETIKLERPGSVWLILQALLPFLLFSDMLHRPPRPQTQQRQGSDDIETDASIPTTPLEEEFFTLTLHGGTNVSKSMSGEYVQLVLLPVLTKIGLPGVEVEIVKRGWAGNAPDIGEARVRIPRRRQRASDGGGGRPNRVVLSGFSVEGRGDVQRVGVTVVASSAHLRDRVYEAIHSLATRTFPPDTLVEPDVLDISGDDRRLYILVVASTSTGWRLGRDYLWSGRACKTPAETEAMVQQAAQASVAALRREIDRCGCVDEFMQDQLVVFQALARGESRVDAGSGREKGTLHAQTMRWVCRKMLEGREVRFDEEGGYEGVGWGTGAGNGEVDGVRSK